MTKGELMNWQEVLYKSSPQYTEAFLDGYNYAKEEMRKYVESMQALWGIITISTETPNGKE